jgi:predicted nucleic acid-binding protein
VNGPTETGSISQRLSQAHLVHVDARVFAIHLLGAPEMVTLTREVISGMREGRIRGQTSVLTLYQLLAELYRRGEPGRASDLARDLMVHTGLEMVPTSSEIAVQAAEVRAQLGGRPERALQVATALVERADVFLTTDSGIRRIAGMSVVNLEDFSSSRPDARAAREP